MLQGSKKEAEWVKKLWFVDVKLKPVWFLCPISQKEIQLVLQVVNFLIAIS